MSSRAPNTVADLAQELGWPGNPDGSDAEALGYLLDDEFENLGSSPRRTFAEQLKIKCPDAMGQHVLVCSGCLHVCLAWFRPDDGRCRVCSTDMGGNGHGSATDSGFGFVLSSYGSGSAAEVLNPAGESELESAWGLADERATSLVKFDEDNKDWDELQDEIEAQREREAREARESAERREREAREKAEKEAAAKKAAAEKAAREKAEREAKEAREKAEKEARERAEKEAREAREKAEKEAREAELRARYEKVRPALGCVLGAQAGEVVRIPDMPESGSPPPETGLWVKGGLENPAPVLLVSPKTPCKVDGQDQPVGMHEIELGKMIEFGGEIFVLEETQEMSGIVAEAIHFARGDKQPGGPWAYWNEEVTVGAAHTCQVNVVDDAVADVHARVCTRFGQVVIEDLSPGEGLWIDGKTRKEAFVLEPGMTFNLGEKGPPLTVGRGEAKLKAGKAARAMKPSRHKRTVFELRHESGKLLRKIFVFTRREVRFGSVSHSADDPTRMINELPLLPGPKELTLVSEKQGGLALTRDGIDVRRDGEEMMYLNGEELEPGKPIALKRRFKISVGEPDDGLLIDGRIYRSPSSVARDAGPARLGMKGGHPAECARFDRKKSNHTYVFLVRMLRIGSEPAAPIRLGLPGVQPSHCRIMFSQGKFLIVAPKEDAPVFLGDFEMDPGVVYPLQINTEIQLGSARLLFRVVEEADFEPEE